MYVQFPEEAKGEGLVIERTKMRKGIIRGGTTSALFDQHLNSQSYVGIRECVAGDGVEGARVRDDRQVF